MRSAPILLLLAGCSAASVPYGGGQSPWDKLVPVLSEHCGGCHGVGKIGPALSWEFGKLLADKVLSRAMPPGQPTADTLSLMHETRLAGWELDLVRAWVADGYSGGSAAVAEPAAYPQVPDLVLLAPPRTLVPRPGDSDEVRCHYLPVPRPVWVRAFEWQVDGLLHHEGAAAVDAAGAAAAIALDGKDGQPGWDCPQGPAIASVGSLGTGGVAGGRVDYPPNAGVLVPTGIVIGVHHVLPASGPITVTDGVRLWLHSERPESEITDSSYWGPSELGCPDGVTGIKCDREWALQHADLPYLVAKAANDDALTRCGYTLASYEAGQIADSAAAGHYRVRSSCAARMPWPGKILGVHPHGHTYLTAVEVRLNGRLLIGFDPYLWQWESAPLLAEPLTVLAGDTVTVTCTWDTPPNHRIIGGWRRGDEMCSVILQGIFQK